MVTSRTRTRVCPASLETNSSYSGLPASGVPWGLCDPNKKTGKTAIATDGALVAGKEAFSLFQKGARPAEKGSWKTRASGRTQPNPSTSPSSLKH